MNNFLIEDPKNTTCLSSEISMPRHAPLCGLNPNGVWKTLISTWNYLFPPSEKTINPKRGLL